MNRLRVQYPVARIYISLPLLYNLKALCNSGRAGMVVIPSAGPQMSSSRGQKLSFMVINTYVILLGEYTSINHVGKYILKNNILRVEYIKNCSGL